MGIQNLLPVGLGTSKNTVPDQCSESIRIALENGYTHIDTAQDYDNEKYIGDGFATANVPREDVFLATKVDPANLQPEDIKQSTERSLDRLGVDYVDLLYIHWPTGEYDPETTLPAFDELRDQGIARNVGLSNFTPEMVDEAEEILNAPIFALQNEFHPFLQQKDLRAYAKKNGYPFVSFSPLIKGKFGQVEGVDEIAAAHDATPAQVVLAWVLSKENVYAIPKATSEEHILQNLAAIDIDLTDKEIQRIDSVDRVERQVWEHGPEFASPWK